MTNSSFSLDLIFKTQLGSSLRKSKDFSTTQILREINFALFQKVKNYLPFYLAILVTLNFDFSELFTFGKS